jgi:TetR/AcrR family transcriptional regulator, cholesterol catabolism regulator
MAQARATSTEQVVAAAARVFLARGYQASTVDDIAREANISKPTVYQYVQSKQWLLDRIVGLVSEDLERCERVVHTAQAPANVRLHWLIQLHVTFAVRYRNSYRVTFSEQAGLSRVAREEFRRWAKDATSNFVDLLVECRGQGTFDWPHDIEVAANLIMSTLTSTHRWFHPDEQLSHEVLVAHIVHLLSGVYHAPEMSDWPMPELPISPLGQPHPDEAAALAR